LMYSLVTIIYFLMTLEFTNKMFFVCMHFNIP